MNNLDIVKFNYAEMVLRSALELYSFDHPWIGKENSFPDPLPERAVLLAKKIAGLPAQIGHEAAAALLIKAVAPHPKPVLSFDERIAKLEQANEQASVFASTQQYCERLLQVGELPDELLLVLRNFAEQTGTRFVVAPQRPSDLYWIHELYELTNKNVNNRTYLRSLRELNCEEADRLIDLAIATKDIQPIRDYDLIAKRLVTRLEATGPGRLQERFQEIVDADLVEFEFVADAGGPGGRQRVIERGTRLSLTPEGRYLDAGCELVPRPIEDSDHDVLAMTPLPENLRGSANTGLAILNIDLTGWPGQVLGIEGKRLVIPLHIDEEFFDPPLFWQLTADGNATPMRELGPDPEYDMDIMLEGINEIQDWHFAEGDQLVSKFETDDHATRLSIENNFGGILDWTQDPWVTACPQCGEEMICIASINANALIKWMNRAATKQGKATSGAVISEELYVLLCPECLVAGVVWQTD